MDRPLGLKGTLVRHIHAKLIDSSIHLLFHVVAIILVRYPGFEGARPAG